jgi:tRNA threonylcarbamoyladenosine biosynthesis protein TsaE
LNKIRVTTKSPSETIDLGKKLGKYADKGKIIFLEGNLGAGKTTLVKGISEYYECTQIAKSPTFILVTTYTGKININHCDFFRLNHSEEIFDLALEEYLENGNLIIEWPEIAKKYLPEPDLKINIEFDKNAEKRIIDIHSNIKIKI